MKLTIITINLNNCEGLRRTIDSVVAQTWRDFEWIVIDGGSTDGSRELIERYADHMAYWVSEPDSGIYNAMNKGIRVAKGEYLQFLNSGDWLFSSTSLERVFSHPFNADIVYGDFMLTDGNVMRIPDYPTLKYFMDASLGHNASFIKRQLFDDGLYDENYRIVSDWVFFVDQILKNKTFQHIDETVTYFDVTGISSTSGELHATEREAALNAHVSEHILSDYRKMAKMERTLSDWQIQDIVALHHKKKLYHRMFSLCIRLIKLIDRHANSHSGKRK